MDDKSDQKNQQSTRDFIRELTGDQPAAQESSSAAGAASRVTASELGRTGTDLFDKTAVHTKDPLVGQVIQDYLEITGLLGEGGMSRVYKAQDHAFQRTVAIKVMRSHIFSDQKAVRRFQQEAVAVGKLSHPHIVNVYTRIDLPSGEPGIVMEFVQGRSLAELINLRGALEIDRVVSILHQACDALAHAHRAGIIHRDLKPSNIMLSKSNDGADTIKVVDFGIAKVSQDSNAGAALTQTGEVFGSPLYMSPEQCAGRQLDARSDIYSLGCVMYEALTGEPPVKGFNVLDTLQRQVTEMPRPVEAIRKNISSPAVVNRIVLKALAKDASKRYQTMEEFGAALNDLDAILKGKKAYVVPRKAGGVSPIVVALGSVAAMGMAVGAVTLFNVPLHKNESPASPKVPSVAVASVSLPATEESKPSVPQKHHEAVPHHEAAPHHEVAQHRSAEHHSGSKESAAPEHQKIAMIPAPHTKSNTVRPAAGRVGRKPISSRDLSAALLQIQQAIDQAQYKGALSAIGEARELQPTDKAEASKWPDCLDELEYEALSLSGSPNLSARWNVLADAQQRERAEATLVFERKLHEPFSPKAGIDLCKSVGRVCGLQNHQNLDIAPLNKLKAYLGQNGDDTSRAALSFVYGLYFREAGKEVAERLSFAEAAKNLDQVIVVEPIYGAKVVRTLSMMMAGKEPLLVKSLLERSWQQVNQLGANAPAYQAAYANLAAAQASVLKVHMNSRRGTRDPNLASKIQKYFSEAIELGLSTNQMELVAVAYHNLGDMNRVSDPATARKYYFQVLQYDERTIPLNLHGIRNDINRLADNDPASLYAQTAQARANLLSALLK